MAIDLYQPFTNPITCETFRCISSTDEAFTMEWTVHPGGYVPFEHVHVNQDEIFHVQRGEMRARVRGVTKLAKVGDTLTIPRGTPILPLMIKTNRWSALLNINLGSII